MVIGHKNPDTDSICSAICYADLKNKITGTDNYVPKRAGHLNEETHFVLNRFGVEAPEYIKDVRPQVMNIEIRHTEGIDSEISVRNAWKLMDSLNVVTLPKTIDNDLVGTDVSFGFQSAVDIATNTIDCISDFSQKSSKMLLFGSGFSAPELFPKSRTKKLDKSAFRAIISVFGSRRRYSSVGRATDL